ncbi:MAG: GFA family protein [Flavobacteriaceae bacterium]
MSHREHRSGGCQCGAVRFRVTGDLGEASVCYCRMCQKASASIALHLVSVRGAEVEWTREPPAWFQSSNHARRPFCPRCGTPLGYEAPDGLALAAVAFDDPADIAPVIAYGIEAKLPYADAIPSLPGHHTMEDAGAVEFLRTLVSHQHPDHDTVIWPPAGGDAEDD